VQYPQKKKRSPPARRLAPRFPNFAFFEFPRPTQAQPTVESKPVDIRASAMAMDISASGKTPAKRFR
jgi:hypothetical protein